MGLNALFLIVFGVYFLFLPSIEEAIQKEKQMKKWKREYKINLINGFNPSWSDWTERVIDF